MIQGNETLSSKDFSKGLVTRADLLKNQFDQSPNCMDIKWYFDGSIGKRFGSSTTNSIQLTSGGAAAGFIVQNSLTNNLLAYWKLDEASGTRFDSFSNLNLNQINDPLSVVGIRNQAANLVRANSQIFYIHTASLSVAGSSFTVSSWVYLASTSGVTETRYIVRQNNTVSQPAWDMYIDETDMRPVFEVLTDGAAVYRDVKANSAAALLVGSWYNIIGWLSDGLHIGISVNLSVNTALWVGAATNSGLKTFTIGGQSNGATITSNIDSRVDEVSLWNRGLSLTERQQLYASGSGNTYISGSNVSPWAMFDFGASAIRWLTVSAGTGIMASSNLGTTFVNIATTRTATYQYLTHSRNVLVATSDAYDRPLYWAGSAGTFAIGFAVNSAPSAKYSVNYQGFLIFLNYQDSNGTLRKRGFAYADENLQLTSAWSDNFDIPSVQDDEVTGSFILSKFLYVSTKTRLFRVAFVGGNPDWSYLKVKDWGFVPRTAKLITLKGGQVVVGLDFGRRLRAFDGYEDVFISDNVENNNEICEFAMKNISQTGSGLTISHAEVDPLEQEYRLNVAIGVNSIQTTHAIVLNGRTLSLYPYSNQVYQCMCVAESDNRQFLMAADRSAYVHILNSGNLDGSIAINDRYDSPLLFGETPQQVLKSQNINTYFEVNSCGKVYYRDAVNLSNQYSPLRELVNLTGTEQKILIEAALDTPSTFNTYQFSVTSSSGTANPWKMSRWDFVGKGKGMGAG